MGLFGFGKKKDAAKNGEPSAKPPSAKAPPAKMPSLRKLPVPGRPTVPPEAGGKTQTPSVRLPVAGGAKQPRAAAPAGAKPAGGGTSPGAGAKPPLGGPPADESRRKRESPKGKQLGALLVKTNAISAEQLNRALAAQRREGGLLGQILARLQFCTKADVGGALKKQLTITTVMLDKAVFDPEALELLPRAFCEKYRLIPFEKQGNQLCVAMSNVLDATAKKDIKEKTQLQLKPFDAGWQNIQAAIAKYLPAGDAPKPISVAEAAAAEQQQAVENLVIELPEEAAPVAAPPAPAKPVPPGAPGKAPPPAAPAATGGTPPKAPPPRAAAAPAPRQPPPSPAPVKPPPAPPAKASEPIALLEPEIIEIIEEEVANIELPEDAAPLAPAQPAPPPAVRLIGDETAVMPSRATPAAPVEPAPVPEPEALPMRKAPPSGLPQAEEAVVLLQEEILPVIEADEAAAVVEPLAESLPEPELIIELAAAAESIPELAAIIAPEPAPLAAPAAIELPAVISFTVKVPVRPLPAAKLPGIPMARAYFAEVVRAGRAEASQRWLADRLARQPLPPVPAPEAKG